MLRIATNQINRGGFSAVFNKTAVRCFSIHHYNSPNSHAPLIERYRPSWPDADFELVDQSQFPQLPPRTVPDDLFNFEYRTSSTKGTAKFYTHLMVNPADIRVRAKFYLKDMPLSKLEKQIFVGLLGPRYNVGNQQFKLTCEKFQNRLENSKYIIFLLESLLADARRIAIEQAENLTSKK
jgi:hypothetical protein